jgi:hypothetical protein
MKNIKRSLPPASLQRINKKEKYRAEDGESVHQRKWEKPGEAMRGDARNKKIERRCVLASLCRPSVGPAFDECLAARSPVAALETDGQAATSSHPQLKQNLKVSTSALNSTTSNARVI